MSRLTLSFFLFFPPSFQKADLLRAYGSSAILQASCKMQSSAVSPWCRGRLVPTREIFAKHVARRAQSPPVPCPPLPLSFWQPGGLGPGRGWGCCCGSMRCLAALVIYRTNLLPFRFHFKAHVLPVAFPVSAGVFSHFHNAAVQQPELLSVFRESFLNTPARGGRYACVTKEVRCFIQKMPAVRAGYSCSSDASWLAAGSC